MKMIVKVGELCYPADASAMTAVRYRSIFNKSLIGSDFSPGVQLDLLYAAIEGGTLPYHGFLQIAAQERYAADILISARAVLSEVTKESGVARPEPSPAAEKKEAPEKEQEQEFDEFYIVSMLSISGLPFELLREVSLPQIMYIVGLTKKLQTGNIKEEPMSDDELLVAMGITKEKLDEIEKYLELHPEARPEQEEN